LPIFFLVQPDQLLFFTVTTSFTTIGQSVYLVYSLHFYDPVSSWGPTLGWAPATLTAYFARLISGPQKLTCPWGGWHGSPACRCVVSNL